MPILSIIFGAILETLGVIGFLLSDPKSITAFIPSFFGSFLILFGLLGHVRPNLRKHVMHGAATVGLLGALGGLGMGLPKIASVFAGEAARPMATIMQTAMGVVCLIFVALCVKSFIDARRARTAQ